MTEFFSFWNPSDQILVWGVNVLLQVTLVTTIALLISTLVHRRPAVRYWVLCSSLLLMFLSPAIAVVMQRSGRSFVTVSLMREESQPVEKSSLTPPPEEFANPVNLGPDFVEDSLKSIVADNFAEQDEHRAEMTLANVEAMATSPVPLQKVTWIGKIFRIAIPPLLFVWLSGVVFLLVRLSIASRRLAVILRTAKPNSDATLVETFEQVGRELHLHRLPELVLSNEVSGPLATGFLHPRVVLPERMVARVNVNQLREILLHEVAHIVRRDQAVALLQNFAAAIFWIHPLVKLLNRRLAQAREEVCDNYVLAVTDAPSYSTTLLTLAELIQAGHTLPGTVGLFTSHWKLERRVADLLDERRSRMIHLTIQGKSLVITLSLFLAMIATSGTMTIAVGQTDNTISTTAADSSETLATQEAPFTRSEQKKSSASKTISTKQLQAWVEQLGESDFRKRRVASSNLLKAGNQALPVLLEGAQRKDAELAIRCFEIIVKMYRGNNEKLRAEAKKSLGKLEKSSNRSVAQRAKTATDLIYQIEKLGGRVQLDTSGKVKMIFLKGTKVTDASLLHLQGLTSLGTLDLVGTRVTDAGLVYLKELTGLVILRLNGTKISGEGLVHLKELTALYALNLNDTDIADASLAHLKGLTGLRSLQLSGTKVTDAGLAYLKGLSNLSTLHLASTNVSDAGLVHLKTLTSLQHLNLMRTKITDAGLAHLKGMTKLSSLTLGVTRISDAGLKHLQGLTNLSNLSLGSTKVSGSGLVYLNGMTKLVWLFLGHTQVTDAGLLHLQGMVNLKGLDLIGTEITGAGLVHLQGLTNLERLMLKSEKIADAGLVHLKGFTKLKGLYLNCPKVTDAGLEHLKGLTALQSLQLNHTQATDAGLVSLKGLKNLTFLELSHTKVTGAGIVHLKGLSKLNNLSLRNTKCRDAGLIHLNGLISLNSLDLSKSLVSEEGVKKLKAALPKCKISWSGSSSALLQKRNYLPAKKSPDQQTVLKWGKTVNGLQAAVELQSLGSPKNQPGMVFDVKFRIRNVSKKPITISSSTWRPDDHLIVLDEKGKKIQSISHNRYTGLTNVKQHLLKPKEVIVLKTGQLGITIDAANSPSFEHPVIFEAHLKQQIYKLRFQLAIPDIRKLDANGRAVVQPGEWSGTLHTGEQIVNLGTIVAQKTVKEKRDPKGQPKKLSSGEYTLVRYLGEKGDSALHVMHTKLELKGNNIRLDISPNPLNGNLKGDKVLLHQTRESKVTGSGPVEYVGTLVGKNKDKVLGKWTWTVKGKKV